MTRTVTLHQVIHTSVPVHGFVTVSSGKAPVNSTQLLLLDNPVHPEAQGTFEEGLAVTCLPGQPTDFIAVTRVALHRDEFRRPFTHSHTILVPASAYAQLNGELELLWQHLGTSPSNVSSSNQLAPLDLAVTSGHGPEIRQSDVDLVWRLLPSVDDLAKLFSAILVSERCNVRLAGRPGEAIDFVKSTLRLVPQGNNILEFATFQPRAELAARYKLVIAPASAVLSLPKHGVDVAREVESRPEARAMAEAVGSRSLEEIRRVKDRLLQDYILGRLLDSCTQAIHQKDWDTAGALLSDLRGQLDSLKGSLAQATWEASRRRYLHLNLELMVATRPDSLPQALKEAAQDTQVFSEKEARDYLNTLLRSESVEAEAKVRVVTNLLRDKTPEQWMSEEVASFILRIRPEELFMDRGIEIPKTVRLLHNTLSGQARVRQNHEEIATWLCRVDFERELLKFALPSTHPSASILIHLLNELQLIYAECSICARQVLRLYFNAFVDMIPVPVLSPRLRTRLFTTTAQFKQAVTRSGILEALESQIARLAAARVAIKEEADRLRRLKLRIRALKP